PISDPHDLVSELQPNRGDQHAGRPHLDLVVVPRRRAVGALRFDHRQREPLALHLTIAPSVRAQQIGAADFEPDEIVGVVGHTHLVGIGIADAKTRGGLRHAHAATPPGAGSACRTSWRVIFPWVPRAPRGFRARRPRPSSGRGWRARDPRYERWLNR